MKGRTILRWLFQLKFIWLYIYIVFLLQDCEAYHIGKSRPSASQFEKASLPNHIGFILDGNARWARDRMLPVKVGHIKGAERAISTLRLCGNLDIPYVTMYIFSTENMQRNKEEIGHIMSIILDTIASFREEAERENIRIRILGDLLNSGFPRDVCHSLRDLESDSTRWSSSDRDTSQLTVCLAINYGSRQDILKACKSIIQSTPESNISEDTLKQHLGTADLPDPDLIIRTGGERRLSNFLLWEAAYSELYFCDEMWPDFDEECFRRALDNYKQRDRRFGTRKELSPA